MLCCGRFGFHSSARSQELLNVLCKGVKTIGVLKKTNHLRSCDKRRTAEKMSSVSLYFNNLFTKLLL
jgi:hypothetical protein